MVRRQSFKQRPAISQVTVRTSALRWATWGSRVKDVEASLAAHPHTALSRPLGCPGCCASCPAGAAERHSWTKGPQMRGPQHPPSPWKAEEGYAPLPFAPAAAALVAAAAAAACGPFAAIAADEPRLPAPSAGPVGWESGGWYSPRRSFITSSSYGPEQPVQ